MLLKLVILCCLLPACSSTRFLFGVEAKCDIDDVFKLVISHLEGDGGSDESDDAITEPKTIYARNKIFFYQNGTQFLEMGFEFEPYARFRHNCTSNGRTLEFKRLLGSTKKWHGLEYMEYSVNLTNKGRKI